MSYKDRSLHTAFNRKIRERMKIFVYGYLSTHPCVRCGYSDIRALDFDHIDPSVKSRNVKNMMNGTPSLNTLVKEIEKCQVLCANCHRIKTIDEKDYLHKNDTKCEMENLPLFSSLTIK